MSEALTKNRKPLGAKAYGSIGHLPLSRTGPGDWHVHEGQARIACEKARDRHDRIIVTEKLDGSCCAVARIGDAIVALTRAGYEATTSPYTQHHYFADWVGARAHEFDWLADGERVAGEWLLQAHGTRYRIERADDLFVAFDLFRGKNRAPYDEFAERVDQTFIRRAALLSDGPPISIDAIMSGLGDAGNHGALDPVEGAVWRVERNGEFDFMAKYVRLEKRDGIYLPDISGQPPLWNFPTEEIAS